MAKLSFTDKVKSLPVSDAARQRLLQIMQNNMEAGVNMNLRRKEKEQAPTVDATIETKGEAPETDVVSDTESSTSDAELISQAISNISDNAETPVLKEAGAEALVEVITKQADTIDNLRRDVESLYEVVESFMTNVKERVGRHEKALGVVLRQEPPVRRASTADLLKMASFEDEPSVQKESAFAQRRPQENSSGRVDVDSVMDTQSWFDGF